VICDPSAKGPTLTRDQMSGRGTTALAFGWKEWTRVSQMDNPVGYLFRVGHSSARHWLQKRLSHNAPNHSITAIPEVPVGDAHRDVTYPAIGDGAIGA
jgi:hypothetical protein